MWYLEDLEGDMLALTDGKYVISLSEAQLASLKKASTLGALQRELLDVVSVGPKQKERRKELMDRLGQPASTTLGWISIAVQGPVPLPDYDALSTNALRRLHDAIGKALKDDDATMSGERKKYFVREYDDWTVCKDKIEGALDQRGEEFVPLDF